MLVLGATLGCNFYLQLVNFRLSLPLWTPKTPYASGVCIFLSCLYGLKKLRVCFLPGLMDARNSGG